VHAFIWERLHLIRGSCIWATFASDVEPAYLFLWASYVLLGCMKSLPMSLGTKFCKCCSFQMTLFWLFFGFWSFGWVLFSSSSSSYFAQAVHMFVLTMNSSRGRLWTHGWYMPLWFDLWWVIVNMIYDLGWVGD